MDLVDVHGRAAWRRSLVAPNSRAAARPSPMSRTGEDVGQPGLPSDTIHLAGDNQVCMAAARRPPRSDPRKSQDFRKRRSDLTLHLAT
jgi:hypothetical protein